MLSFAGAVAISGVASLAMAASVACPNNLPASCQNTTAVANTCCFVSAGLLLHQQFWDYDPSIGPSTAWGIHGLWPDWCDGSYPESCDSTRDYTDIKQILTNAGDSSLVTYMETYWQSNDETPESFWAHEWSEHGTCISTLDPSCYTNYKKGDEVVDYFNRVVDLYKTVPTYTWLSNAGITPSSSKTYERNAILDALQGPQGANVVIACDDDNISSVSYYFNIKGSLQDGTFEAVSPPTIDGTCPSSGIKYNLKKSSS